MTLKEILKNNKKFVENFNPTEMDSSAKKELAIVTCMDTRLIDFLEPALGLKRGDANIIKNAGNTVDTELIRSLAIAIYAIGIKEIIVIGHTNCGMAIFTAENIAKAMRSRGIDQKIIRELDLETWLGNFNDEKENVMDMVNKIKKSPIIPENINVNGLIIDICTGRLEKLT